MTTLKEEIIGLLTNHSTQVAEIQDISKETIDYINKVNQFYAEEILSELEKRIKEYEIKKPLNPFYDGYNFGLFKVKELLK